MQHDFEDTQKSLSSLWLEVKRLPSFDSRFYPWGVFSVFLLNIGLLHQVALLSLFLSRNVNGWCAVPLYSGKAIISWD